MSTKKRDGEPNAAEAEEKGANEEPLFSKRAFLDSSVYMLDRELLRLILDDEKLYTISEVNEKIKQLKGKI